jgi:hypothetical protein
MKAYSRGLRGDMVVLITRKRGGAVGIYGEDCRHGTCRDSHNA